MYRKAVVMTYSDERPYGSWALQEEGIEFRKRKMQFLPRLFSVLDGLNTPRTMFILGDYLERCLSTYSENELQRVYNPSNPLMDIQQHTFAHHPITDLPDAQQAVLSTEEIGEDIQRASLVIRDILGVQVRCVQLPYGYEGDLSNNLALLEQFKKLGIILVTSDARSSGGSSLFAEVTASRMPHAYAHVGYPTIVELPIHGWQDVVFTAAKARQFNLKLPTPESVQIAFGQLLDAADALAQERDVVICLGLHPWALMEYDPELTFHKEFIVEALGRGFMFWSAMEVYQN